MKMFKNLPLSVYNTSQIYLDHPILDALLEENKKTILATKADILKYTSALRLFHTNLYAEYAAYKANAQTIANTTTVRNQSVFKPSAAAVASSTLSTSVKPPTPGSTSSR